MKGSVAEAETSSLRPCSTRSENRTGRSPTCADNRPCVQSGPSGRVLTFNLLIVGGLRSGFGGQRATGVQLFCLALFEVHAGRMPRLIDILAARFTVCTGSMYSQHAATLTESKCRSPIACSNTLIDLLYGTSPQRRSCVQLGRCAALVTLQQRLNTDAVQQNTQRHHRQRHADHNVTDIVCQTM